MVSSGYIIVFCAYLIFLNNAFVNGMRCVPGYFYNSCGTACPATCSNPDPVCISECVEGCYCPPDKPIILSTGICGTLDDCNNTGNTGSDENPPPPSCDGGLVWSDCALACDRTCSNPNPPCDKQCVPKCTCPEEFPILASPGQCIAAEKCPSLRSVPCSSIRRKQLCKKNNNCRWIGRTSMCVHA